MRTATIRLLALLFSAPLSAAGTLSLEMEWSGIEYEPQRLFNSSDRSAWRNQLEERLSLQWQQGGVALQAELSGQQREDGENRTEGTLHELFYDFSTDFLGPSLDLSIGKRQLDMGVGYGYRPLDMVQQEQRQRQRLSAVTLEGVSMLSVEHFTERGSVGLLHASPDDPQWAVKGYGQRGEIDLQWLLHHDQARQTSAALGFSWVGGLSTELHGALRLQGQYPGTPHYDYNSVTQTVTEQATTEQGGVAALLGMHWSHPAGVTLLSEYWVDRMSLSNHDWDSIIADRAWLNGGGAVNSANAAAMASLGSRLNHALSQTNLKRENLFLRLSHEGGWADTALELLLHPEDGGHSVTLRMERELFQNQRFSFALRQFNGDGQSVMGNIGDQRQLLMQWEVLSAME